MKVLKNIGILLVTIAVFLSSNGFIIEKYLCFSCESQHNEIAFFEFGELKHKHPPCNECTEHGHICDCSKKGSAHEENSEVKYFALDVLFSDDSKTVLTPTLILNDVNQLGIDIWNTISSSIYSYKLTTLFRLFKIPPTISQFESSTDFCSALSVFRL